MKKFVPFIIALASIFIGFFIQFTSLDLSIFNIFEKTMTPPEETDSILLVNVDDNAIEKIGTFPLTRDVYADSIIALKELGAESVVFDLSFLDPSNVNVNTDVLNSELPSTIDENFEYIDSTVAEIMEYYEAEELSSADAPDARDVILAATDEAKNAINVAVGNVTKDIDDYLSDSLKFIGNAYLTLTFNEEENVGVNNNDEYLASSIALKNITDNGDTKSPEPLSVTPAIDILLKKAKRAGFVNANPDVDGYLRRVYLLRKYQDNYYGQLTFTPMLNRLGDPEIIVDNKQIVLKDAKISETETKDIVIPRCEDGSILVNYPHKEFEEYNNISLYDAYIVYLLENELYEILCNMNDGGFFNNWEGEFTPVDLFESAQYIKNEFFDGNTEFTFDDYLMYKEEFLASVKSMLGGNFQNVLKVDIDDIELLDWIDEVFDECRRRYSDLMRFRTKTEKSVKNAMCIIGTSATSTSDYGIITFQEDYPRVGIHYSTANMFLTGEFLDDAPWWLAFIIAIALCLIYSFIAKSFKSTGKQIIFGVSSIIVTIGLLLAYFLLTKTYIGVAIPLIAITSDFIITTVYNLLSTSHDKKFITNAFSQCLSKDVVDDIVANPNSFKLGGQKVDMTAIFTDIQKFSGFSELLTAGQLVALLNYYLTRMSNIIMDERGTVDKYEGDAIVAFVGAPVKMEDHAARACAAAINMKKAEVEMNKEIELIAAAPKPDGMDDELYEAFTIMVKNNRRLFTRIGLNSGEMTAGYMGSENKKNYTMMGNNVNLASRLEGVNKQYSTGGILMSEATRDMLGDRFLVRSLDRVQVVNVTTPIRLYELIDEKTNVTEEMTKFVDAWEQTMKIFEKGDYAKALELFKKLSAARPSDNVAKYYVTLIEKFFIKGIYPTAKDDFGVEYNAENPEGMKPEWVGTKYEIKGTFKLLQK